MAPVGNSNAFMNPVKLLASRNIIISIGVLAILFAAFVVVQTRTGSAETVPPAERVGAPPSATGEVVPLNDVLTAYQRNRTAALRRFHNSPLSAQVDAVTPVQKSGWAASVTANGGRATLYFADGVWPSIAPVIASGQKRTFTCADWQSGPSGSVAMYGCGIAETN